MCGRYHLESEERLGEIYEIIQEINRKHNGSDDLSAMKTGEISPTDLAPVVSKNGPILMKWGFTMRDSKKPIINARAETAKEKPMFKESLAHQRVAIPTNGFYEWTHPNGKMRDKYLFKILGEDMLYLAGISTEAYTKNGKEHRYVILTTKANESMKPFHDRMPVCLSKTEQDQWINDPSFVLNAQKRPQLQLVPLLVSQLAQISFF